MAIASLKICSEETSQVMGYNLEEEIQNYTSLVLQKVSGTVYDNVDEQRVYGASTCLNDTSKIFIDDTVVKTDTMEIPCFLMYSLEDIGFIVKIHMRHKINLACQEYYWNLRRLAYKGNDSNDEELLPLFKEHLPMNCPSYLLIEFLKEYMTNM